MSEFKTPKEIIEETKKLIANVSKITKTVSEYTAPRYLTNSEIDDIISSIKYLLSSNSETSTHNRASLLRMEKSKLREFMIVPEAIPEFKQLYLSKINLGTSEPGTATGMTAAEAISAPVSQQTFNSFHSAGSSKNMIGGIDGFMETIQVMNRKHPLMIVYFKSRVTVDEILDRYTAKILTVTVGDTVFDYTIEAQSVLFPNGVRDPWYNLYFMTHPSDKIPNSSFILRLYLNLDVLYRHKIRVTKVVEILEKEKIVKCFYSPIIRYTTSGETPNPAGAGPSGIIVDVYINNIDIIIKDKEFAKSKVSETEAPFFYFQNVLVSKLGDLKISGLNRITDVEPIIKPIEFSIYSEYPLSRYLPQGAENRDLSVIKLNRVFMNYNGITLDDTIRLLKGAGVIDAQPIGNTKFAKDFDDADILVKVPDPQDFPKDFPKDTAYSASQLVKFKINKDRKEIREYRKEQKKIKTEMIRGIENLSLEEQKRITIEANNIKIYKEPSLIYNESNLVYAETSGSDFSNLIKLDEVDITRSYTNNMYDILYTFGIEAVYSYIVRDLLLLVKMSDMYIDPRHVSLVASWMTQFGIITPLTVKGMSYHKMGPIASASYWGALAGVRKDTIHSNIDYLTNATASIAVGKLSRLGTGLPEILTDYKKIKNLLEEKRKLGNKKLAGNTISNLISLLEQGATDPTDQTQDNTTELNPNLDFEVSTGVIDILTPGIFEPSFINPSMILPQISPELKLAIQNDVVCESPEVPIEVNFSSSANLNQVESLPMLPIMIPQGLKQASEVTEKPPEIKVINQISSLDDLF